MPYHKCGESRMTGQLATEGGRGTGGEDGREERGSQRSKGEKEEQFHV